MGKIRRGGYLIYFWIGDHGPNHVHVLKDKKLIAKVRLEDLTVLQGRMNRRLQGILQALKDEGKL